MLPELGRDFGVSAQVASASLTAYLVPFAASLLGGLAAEATWRLAFIGVALVAVVLAVAGLPGELPRGSGSMLRLRTAWRAEVLLAGVVALVGWGCLGGVSFLVAFRAQDAF